MNQRGKIGIVGGGQLARMLTEAAQHLGFKVTVLTPTPNSPASQVGAAEIIGDLYDQQALQKLSEVSDYITVEIEHLNAAALEEVGSNVNPSPKTIGMIQDKYNQKVFLKDAGIPTASFAAITDTPSAKTALKNFGGKMLIKTRHGAYDGRGNMVVSSEQDIVKAFENFSSDLYVEEFVSFSKELAAMVARDIEGNVAIYPVTETIHQRNICVETITPAQVESGVAEQARQVALKVSKYIQGAGVYGVEMFLTVNGDVIVNEIAPRVHNSGHYTIEACETSQFEQHIRAITGMELGSTNMKVKSAVMVNILGERNGETKLEGIDKAGQYPHTYVHLYGKSPTKVDRKMGHITVTADSTAEAQKIAKAARAEISV